MLKKLLTELAENGIINVESEEKLDKVLSDCGISMAMIIPFDDMMENLGERLEFATYVDKSNDEELVNISLENLDYDSVIASYDL